MPIEIGIKKPPLGDCPVCGKPLRELLGMIRCSDGRCDFVKSQEKEVMVQREEARIQTAGALLAQEERGRPRGMFPRLDLLGSRKGEPDKFVRDMVDPTKDPMENGKAKKRGDTK